MHENADQRVLEYAGKPKSSRRFRKLVLVAGFAVALASAAYWGPSYYRQAKVVLDERKFTHYRQDRNWIAFSNDPEECAGLLKLPDYARLTVYYIVSGIPYDTLQVGFIPQQTDALLPYGRSRFKNNEGVLLSDAATLFCHLRRSPQGNEQLIHVTMSLSFAHRSYEKSRSLIMGEWQPAKSSEQKYPYSLVFWEMQLGARIYQPATLKLGTARAQVWAPNRPYPASSLSDGSSFIVPLRFDPTAGTLNKVKLRVYFAQPDESDDSRFTLRYSCDELKGVLSARLTDKDGLEWKVESGSLTPSAP